MTLLTVLAVGLLAAAAPPDVQITLTGRPVSLGVFSPCPDGYLRVGSSRICVLRASKTDRSGFAIGSITERVIQRDVLPGGSLTSRSTYVFRWVDREGTTARIHVRGRVTAGTGRYANAQGTVTGRGVQRNGRWRLRVVARLR